MFGGLTARLHHRHAPMHSEVLSDNYDELLVELDKALIKSARTSCGLFIDAAQKYTKYDPAKCDLLSKLSNIHENLSRQEKLSSGQGFIVDFVTIAKSLLPEENSKYVRLQSETLDFLSDLSTFDFPTNLNPEKTCG